MSGWRHEKQVEEAGVPPFCGECATAAAQALSTDPTKVWALCTTPTPDPASPCGQRVPFDDGYYGACGATDTTGHRHPHQPTRCTCGHPLEATR